MTQVLEGRPRLVVHVSAWMLVGVLVTLLLHAFLRMPWAPAAAFALPLSAAAVPMSVSGFYLSRALPLTPSSVWRVAGTIGGSAVVTGGVWATVGLAWWIVLGRFAGGFFQQGTEPAAVSQLLVVVGAMAYVVAMVLHYLFRAFERAADVERRVLQSEVSAREAELRALRAQIDPHFLFNSLNSISGLVGVDPARARSMCQKLGDFLRDSLTLGGAGRIPLSREVALVRQYLEIEQVRFGQRLRVQAAATAEAGGVLVPALLLQPLVENAVRHGIATCVEGGVVQISADRSAAQAVIVVENPRDPDTRSRKGTGLGLDIVRRRLHAAFGDDASMNVETFESGYRVTLTVPAGAAAHE